MTFQDILKNNFLESVTQVTAIQATVSLGSALIIGMMIFLIYRSVFSGVMYSKPFNVSLVMLTILTTFVILAVTSNVVLSLGMVGALSIVRFRTAIKDPLDLVFLFWSITAGIILGAGFLALGFIGSLFIGAVLLGFDARTESEHPYVLLLRLEALESEAAAYTKIHGAFRKVKVRSKTFHPGHMEAIYEIRMKGNDIAFLEDLKATPGVEEVSLVSFNGEYAG